MTLPFENDKILKIKDISCPLFSVCSGCKYQKEVRNPPVWEEIIRFFKEIDPFLDIELFSKEILEYRSKIKLAVRGSVKEPKIGLFKEGSHEVVDLRSCPLHFSQMNKAIEDIRFQMERFEIEPYEEEGHLGRLRYLQMLINQKTLKIQLTLVWNGSFLKENELAFVNQLYKLDFYHSIWANFVAEKTNSILGENWKLLEGDEDFYQEIKGISFHFHPSCFSQVHIAVFEEMIAFVDCLMLDGKTLLELYSGVGCMGVSLAEKAKEVTLIESSPFAKSSFEKTMQKLPISIQKKCHFLSGFAEEMSWNDSDVILVDPPRKGLSKKCKERIFQSKAEKIIYVSCGFESFQRDAKELLDKGWKIESAKGFLLFPGTNHVELIAGFVKTLE